jgi:hypothetical protein
MNHHLKIVLNKKKEMNQQFLILPIIMVVELQNQEGEV